MKICEGTKEIPHEVIACSTNSAGCPLCFYMGKYKVFTAVFEKMKEAAKELNR